MKKYTSLLLALVLLSSLVLSCAPEPTATPVPPTAVPAKPTAVPPTAVPPTEVPPTPVPPTPVPPTPEPEPVTLTMWHAYGGATGEKFEALVTEFNETHPYITIEPSYGGTLWTMRDKLLTAIAGDAGPDICQIDQFWCPELAEADSIVKMWDFIEADPGFNPGDVHEKAWETGTYQGEVWTMPFSMSNVVLYYNKAMFKAAGLDPEKAPATWDELVEYAQALTKDTDGDGTPDEWGLELVLTANAGCVYNWIAFLWQAGGELFNEDFTKSTFNGPAGVEATQFWVDLVHKYKVLPLAPPQGGFNNDLIAMTLASTSGLGSRLASLGPEKLGVAFMPKGKEYATGVGGANLAIFKSSPDYDASYEFVKWMTSPEINLRWSKSTGYLPLRQSVVDSDDYQAYLKSEPRAQVIIDQMPYAIVRPNILAYAPGSREMGLAVEEAVFGNLDPQAVLDAAAEKVDAMLAK